MNPPKFKMADSPLALVVGQVGFSYAPELSGAGDLLRLPFKELGLPIAEPRNEVSFQLNGLRPSTPPNVQHSTFWLFTSPDKANGVAIGPKHVAFITNQYSHFSDYADWVVKVVDTIQDKFPDIYFNNIGIRYFNVFKPESIPCNWLVDSARGIAVGGIGTDHFHHRYEFWCATRMGALHARCALEHGGAIPKSLNFAGAMFPSTAEFGKDDHVYHLDIFENSKALDPQKLLTSSVVKEFFSEQHRNIDAAFLNFLSEEGRNHFGWAQVT